MMNVDQPPEESPDHPRPEGEILSSIARQKIDALITPGTEVWVWSHDDREWIAATVTNTDLLLDRCLFEVRCERNVGSDFLDGYGQSLHSGFHGTDWHFREGSDPPPEHHPLANFPGLEMGCWVRIKNDSELCWGSVSLLNSAAKKFSLEFATDWNAEEELPVGRQHFDFHEFLDMHLLSSDFMIPSLSKDDLIVFSWEESSTRSAYRICGYDSDYDTVLLQRVSTAPVEQLLAVATDEVFELGEIYAADALEEIFNRFPQLSQEGKKIVIFEHQGERLIGETLDNDELKTLPAFLEVLIEKSDEEIAEHTGSMAPDFFHRYQVSPEAILEVRRV
jgi:hypothetical protein